jgi:hypothetical protein
MSTADWAFAISVLSLIVGIVTTISRSVESTSTRRISVFTSTVDKYVGQICDSMALLEKQCGDYADVADFSKPEGRKSIYDACNRNRRHVSSFINTILKNNEFDVSGFDKFDDIYDGIMENAERVRSGGVDEIPLALDSIQTDLSSGRAAAYAKRDAVISVILRG